MKASPANFITLDPFQLLLVCVFTITSVSSKMTAYLHKFTDSNFISLAIPCIISIILVLNSGSDIGSINTVANYIATFFAYQFLVIIPFGLFYLRSSQLTAGETESESLSADLMLDNPETQLSERDLSLQINANEATMNGEQSSLLSPMHNSQEMSVNDIETNS